MRPLPENRKQSKMPALQHRWHLLYRPFRKQREASCALLQLPQPSPSLISTTNPQLRCLRIPSSRLSASLSTRETRTSLSIRPTFIPPQAKEARGLYRLSSGSPRPRYRKTSPSIDVSLRGATVLFPIAPSSTATKQSSLHRRPAGANELQFPSPRWERGRGEGLPAAPSGIPS